MSGITWDTFERYRQKGLDARRAGQWDSARVYLLEAARAMVSLSKEAQGEDLRQGRQQMAARLLELARDCEAAARDGRRQPAPIRRPHPNANAPAPEADGEPSA